MSLSVTANHSPELIKEDAQPSLINGQISVTEKCVSFSNLKDMTCVCVCDWKECSIYKCQWTVYFSLTVWNPCIYESLITCYMQMPSCLLLLCLHITSQVFFLQLRNTSRQNTSNLMYTREACISKLEWGARRGERFGCSFQPFAFHGTQTRHQNYQGTILSVFRQLIANYTAD